MTLEIYPRLSTRSRRCMNRRYKKGWHHKKFVYKPKSTLIYRLMRELKWDFEKVRREIMRERRVILRLNGWEVGENEIV